MDRREQITKFLTPQQRGIEIGPYFCPLMPKKKGNNCLVLDVIDGPALRKKAAGDSNIPAGSIASIEDVDFVGSSTEIGDLVTAKFPPGSFDYVVSSHNMEHLPNPIRFLQGCQQVLKPGGVLSMAVPDRRVCFDYFRPHSTLADWLEAYFQRRQRPTHAQIFLQDSLHSRYRRNGHELVGFSLDDDPANIVPLQSLKEAFTRWSEFVDHPDETYHDTHCSAFTPASMELILRDLKYLGVIQLDIQLISGTYGNEFFVRLVNPDSKAPAPVGREEFYETRHKLLHRINDEACENSNRVYQLRRQPPA
jgi:SAM-dependent methyltransferase